MESKWSDQTRIFLISVLLILSALFLVYIHELIRPLVIAGLVAFVLYPIATFIRRRTPLNQKAAGNLVFFLFLAMIVGTSGGVMPALLGDIESLGEQLVDIIDGLNEFFSHTTIMGYKLFSGIPAEIEQSILDVLKPSVIYESISAITENLVWVGVVLIVVYYLMVDWPKARQTVFEILPDNLKRDGYELFKRIKEIWMLYLRGQISMMLILGVLAGVMAVVVGLPAAIIMGLVAAVLGLIPSVGSSVFIFIAGLVAVFYRGTLFGLPKFGHVLIVVLAFTGIHLFENYWLRPKVIGDGLSLHPAVILVSVLGAVMLNGPLLALVVVPLISTAGVILKYILRMLSNVDPWDENADMVTLEEVIERDGKG
ncbi:MAG: AI-2E family transporter [Anaerolineales bacterium]|nr:AI-2E family transporter [Anaerolineales bacterium]